MFLPPPQVEGEEDAGDFDVCEAGAEGGRPEGGRTPVPGVLLCHAVPAVPHCALQQVPEQGRNRLIRAFNSALITPWIHS